MPPARRAVGTASRGATFATTVAFAACGIFTLAGLTAAGRIGADCFGLETGLAFAFAARFALAAGLAFAAGLALAAGLAFAARFALAAGLAFAAGFAFAAGLAFVAGFAFAAGFAFVAGFAFAADFAFAAGLTFTDGLADLALPFFADLLFLLPVTFEITAASSFLTVLVGLPRFGTGFATGFFAFAAGRAFTGFFAAFAAAGRLFELVPFAMLLFILHRYSTRPFRAFGAAVATKRPRVIA